MSHPDWKQAMFDELEALNQQQTWSLVPRTSTMNVVGSRWVHKVKLKTDGTLERLKARLVAKGYHQLQGVDFTKTYSHVVKLGTIRLILSIATIKGWKIGQLDVKNAFLHISLSEEIFLEQPPDFKDKATPNSVCKFKKAIYG